MIYQFQEFTADLDAGCLNRDGAEVHLRRKSFQVLAFLLENHSRLVAKEEIFDACWPDLAVTDDVLVGVIGELRKVLGDNSENPVYIRTMRRAGYRFIAPVEIVGRERPELPQTPPPPDLPQTPPPAMPGHNRWSRQSIGIWVTAALVIGGASGWLLATNSLPSIHWKAPLPVREVAWWRFDETGDGILDVSGNGNSGEIRAGATRRKEKIGGALEFDGIHGWATGDARTLPRAGEPLTFTAWIQVASTSSDFTNIFQYGYRHSGTSGSFQSTFLALVRPDGRWESQATGAGVPIIGKRLDDGRWHQIAVRYDGLPANTAGVYTDGREDSRGNWFRQPAPAANELWSLGQYAGPSGTPFHGKIGDTRLYHRALTAYQINALYQCTSAESDYLLPLYASIAETIPNPADGRVDGLRNTGRDYAGAQFAKRMNNCSLPWVEGADMGQNIRISADFLVPRDSAGHHTQAGPFFRSRLAAPGDGIMGGTSAGYWVALDSNSTITVRRLNPLAVVAFASIQDFDASVFHHLEAAAIGDRLQVRLDGRLVEFQQEGRVTNTVAIPPVWDNPPAVGKNQGAAGIEFSAIDSRGQIGGQEARHIRVEQIPD